MLTLAGIFLMGLQLGATACTLSCMPIMMPVLLGGTDNKSEATTALTQYFGAKVFAYTLIALLAFFGADFVKSHLPDSALFSKGAALFVIALGGVMLYQAFREKNSCSTGACRRSKGLGYIGTGFFSSFNFCLPVSTLIAVSALSGSVGLSILFGLLFGLGAVTIPFLFFYLFIFRITSTVLAEFSRHKKHLKAASALLLILIGLLLYGGKIHL